jgi:putative endonuclease
LLEALPGHPGNPRNRIEGESPLEGKDIRPEERRSAMHRVEPFQFARAAARLEVWPHAEAQRATPGPGGSGRTCVLHPLADTGWAMMDGAFFYILECADGSYYVGTARLSLEKRVAEHNAGRFGGYTAQRRPVTLVFSQWFDRITDAIAAERQVKGWSRAKKQALIRGDFARLPELSKRRGHASRRVAARADCKIEHDQWRCAAPQHEGRSESAYGSD